MSSSTPWSSSAKLASSSKGHTIALQVKEGSSRTQKHSTRDYSAQSSRPAQSRQSQQHPATNWPHAESEKRSMAAQQSTSSRGISRYAPPDLSELPIDSEKAPARAPTYPDSSSSAATAAARYSRSARQAAASSPRAHYPPRPSQDESSPLSCIGCSWFTTLPPRLRLWLSFGMWIATSLGFLLAIAFWKTEVFTGLDNLSHWLVSEGWTGYGYLFFLIVLTTIPPLPLYSTLMMLAGYTWGTWTGFLLSYTSSMFGAIVVFLFSRHFFGSSLVHIVAHAPSFARTVRAISKNPRLLFLVRLAPYPYNVMNVLLAACPSLTLRRYVGCTGISLLKVVVHTSIGNGIHSFAGYYGVGEHSGEDAQDGDEHSDTHSNDLARWSTIIGVVLCVLLLVYLGHIARKAVDGELEDEDYLEGSQSDLLPVHHSPRERGRSDTRSSRHARVPSTAEERVAFLSPGFGIEDDEDDGTEMTESTLSAGLIVRSRSPSTG